MRFPPEIRNNIYDFVISGLPQIPTVPFLPAIAAANLIVHQEFMSKYLSLINYNIRSLPDVWHLGMLLDMHSPDSQLRQVTTLTITNFTAIAHTQKRSSPWTSRSDQRCRISGH